MLFYVYYRNRREKVGTYNMLLNYIYVLQITMMLIQLFFVFEGQVFIIKT